jgi:hypothetical protein
MKIIIKTFAILVLFISSSCKAQQMAQTITDVYKLKSNEQQFINKPLKKLLDQIKPEIKMANLAGLNLQDSYGTWPRGGGSNPGQLGQNIRGMVLPPNAVRQTTSTNSAPNKGQCN